MPDNLDEEDLTTLEKWLWRHLRCKSCNHVRLFGIFSSHRTCAHCRKAAIIKDAQRQRDLSEQLYLKLCDAYNTHVIAKIQGEITASEHAGLHDTKQARYRLYKTIMGTLLEKKEITAHGQKAMDEAQKVLNLTDFDVSDLKEIMVRQQQLLALQRGEIPNIAVPIPLQKNEIGHFCFSGVEYCQERVVGREYVGGSSGVSFRIARGMSYHVGTQRGHLISRTAIVHVARGELILTSKRLVFSGDTAFSIPLVKILHFDPFNDAVSVTKDSTAQNNKPFYFLYPDGQILCAALSLCLNRAVV